MMLVKAILETKIFSFLKAQGLETNPLKEKVTAFLKKSKVSKYEQTEGRTHLTLEHEDLGELQLVYTPRRTET